MKDDTLSPLLKLEVSFFIGSQALEIPNFNFRYVTRMPSLNVQQEGKITSKLTKCEITATASCLHIKKPEPALNGTRFFHFLYMLSLLEQPINTNLHLLAHFMTTQYLTMLYFSGCIFLIVRTSLLDATDIQTERAGCKPV